MDSMNFTSKFKTITTDHFLMPVIRYNFRKIQWAGLEKSVDIGPKNNLFLDPKITCSSILGVIRIFLKNPELPRFPLFNARHRLNFRKIRYTD